MGSFSKKDFQSDQSFFFEKRDDIESVSKENFNLIFPLQNYNDNFFALKEQADNGSAKAQYKIGLYFEKEKNVPQFYKYAFFYYKMAADQGHREAQVRLAMLFDAGKKPNYQQAFYYYKLAAEQESPTALTELGRFYYEGKGGVEKSPERAIYYYQKAMDLGNLTALHYLAEAYQQGIGVEKSEEKANFFQMSYLQKRFKHAKEEADEGDSESQASVGSFFEYGEGIEKSIESAVYYYQLSANQHSLRGLFHLAECFAEGKGVQKSSEKAIHYYKLGADRGDFLSQMRLARYLLENKINEEEAVCYLMLAIENEQSCDFESVALCEYDLGECLEEGIGIKKSEQNALSYYKIASDHGCRFAQNRLGDAYLKGELGLNESPAKAVEYYRLAANQGCSSSLEMLGECYEKGKGVPQSKEKAFYYYHLAAEINIKKGYGTSIYALARCYELGVGTEKSLNTAIYYYKYAAENGLTEGYNGVVRCYKEMGGEENFKKAAMFIKMAADQESKKLHAHKIVWKH